MRYYLAVDIGASSGRHILGHLEDGRPVLEEVYRFDNLPIRKNGHDCWDLEGLWQHILNGLRACKAQGKVPLTMGIDTWGVDFLLLDSDGAPVCDGVTYRDARTTGVAEALEERVPFRELYARTGIQHQNFNTIYQLTALKAEHPEQMARAKHFAMLPEFFHYRLTGRLVNEYTNATTTALVDARSRTWDGALLAELGLPQALFGALSMPGTEVGGFTGAIQREVGFDCTVLLPPTHDTASAFLAAPLRDGGAVCLSSGTWSLLGVERSEPVTTEESRAFNFTNEGGYDYRFRYLKNIMGLWMLQSIRRELCRDTGREWTFPELAVAAQAAGAFQSVVDPNDPRFLSPAHMGAEICAACRENGQPEPSTTGELAQCVYRSLALCYREAVTQLEQLTGKTYTAIHIVGGGCRDKYLNRLTAAATGLPVQAGPVEASALGNLLAQMLAVGAFSSLTAARRAVEEGLYIEEVFSDGQI